MPVPMQQILLDQLQHHSITSSTRTLLTQSPPTCPFLVSGFVCTPDNFAALLPLRNPMQLPQPALRSF